MDVNTWMDSIGYYDDETSEFVSLLLYGAPGVGKTTVAGTFPKPFFIDTDRGGRTLKKLHLPYLKLQKGEKVYKILKNFYKRFKAKEKPFDKLEVKTIVFDSVMNLADFMMAELLKYPVNPKTAPRNPIDAKPEWDDYNCLRNRVIELMYDARDLGIHVVATAGEKLDKDEAKGTFVGKPFIMGSSRDIIGHAFDEYYHLTVEGKGDSRKYIAYTAPHTYFGAKSRDGMKFKIESPTYAKLFRAWEEALKGKDAKRKASS